MIINCEASLLFHKSPCLFDDTGFPKFHSHYFLIDDEFRHRRSCLARTLFLSSQDEENAQLNLKIKEIEEGRAKLQKTTNIQRTQIEKHKALANEAERKCEVLQLQVSALNKVSRRSMKNLFP